MNQTGQTLIEFCWATTLAALTVLASVGLLKVEWDRARCAILVFEATHRALYDQTTGSSSNGINLQESDTEIQGHALCGSARESVTLQKLEADSI